MIPVVGVRERLLVRKDAGVIFFGFSPDCFDAWLIVNILDPTMSDLDSVSGNR